MKHYLLFLLTMLCALAYSQDDYTPMLKDGRRWYYKNWHGETNYTSWITVECDSVYQGRPCKYLTEGDDYFDHYPNESGMTRSTEEEILESHYIFAWEENKQLIHVEKNIGDTEPDRWVLLDFNPSADEKYRVLGYTIIEDSIEVKGRNYRRITYSYCAWQEGDDPDVHELDYLFVKVEGIGISTSEWQSAQHCFLPYKNLVAVYDGDELIFEYDDFFVAGKTPAKIVMTTMDEESSARAPIFDLTGKRITDPRKGEFYIKDGKKIVK